MVIGAGYSKVQKQNFMDLWVKHDSAQAFKVKP